MKGAQLLIWSEKSRGDLDWVISPAAPSSGWSLAATVDQTDIRRSERHDW